MGTLCIQCAMQAILEDKKPPTFDETPEEHQKRVHPDLIATKLEREELNKNLLIKFSKK